MLGQAMAKLLVRHREVLELREREGLSYQSIADHLVASLGTVEALLWRARKALRREFLALAADEGPALAAGPVAAASLSRLGWLRLRLGRLGQWANQHAQPLVAGAAAVTAAVALGLPATPAPSGHRTAVRLAGQRAATAGLATAAASPTPLTTTNGIVTGTVDSVRSAAPAGPVPSARPIALHPIQKSPGGGVPGHA